MDAEHQRTPSVASTIWLGTQYWRPPTPPPEEFAADIPRIADVGLAAIRIWACWGWHETSPGLFDWEDTDRLFDLALRHGLKVVPTILMEVPPDSLRPPYPLTKQDGRASNRSHFIGTPIPCFDQPEVRQAGEPFIRALVENYRGHPALLCWDVWNEPRSRDECACPASAAAYHAWLAARFGSIRRFNACFGKRYADFTSVPINGYGNEYSEDFLWRQWAAASVADRVAWVSAVVRQCDPDHPVTAHSGVCSPLQSVRHDTCVDGLMSQRVDFYGASFPVSEPRSQLPGGQEGASPKANAHLGALVADWARSGSDPAWIAELYSDAASPWQHGSGSGIRFWSLLALAHGARGLFYWQFKPERLAVESGGYGLVDRQGGETPRSAAVRDVCRLVRRHESILSQARPLEPQVALLYDHRSHLLSELETARVGAPDYRAALHGIYRLFWELDIPVAWVDAGSLDRLEGYRLVYLACPRFVDAELASCLTRFVEAGGVLISEPGLGSRGENTWLSGTVPAAGLDALFGVVETEGRVVPESPITFPGLGSSTWQGYAVGIAPGEAVAVAEWPDGGPAVTSRRVRAGSAVYLSGFQGICYGQRPGADTRGCWRELLASFGVRAPFPSQSCPQAVRRRVSGGPDGRLLWSLNTSDTQLDLPVEALASSELAELRPEGEAPVGPGSVVGLAPMSVRIFLSRTPEAPIGCNP